MADTSASPAPPSQGSPAPEGMSAKSRRAALIAAIFLMSMSAVGPGFITQTATFTIKHGAAFAFAILASVLIDFVVQANVWRIVTVTRMRAPAIANAAIPGSGYLLAILVIIGGLFFNIGNIGGAGLGLNAMIDLDPKIGGAAAALAAIAIFLSRRAGVAMDRVVYVAAFIKLALILYAAFVSGPPVAQALYETVLPSNIDFFTITTIVGGTVGGYITYAGAHRLLDKGTVGVENIGAVNRAALTGIAITGVLRYILFLAILGVVASGVVIDLSGKGANPAGQAFHAAAGDIGYRLFGAVFLASAMTSIIGAAYTSVSFLTAFKPDLTERQRNNATVGFIAFSLVAYMLITTPPAAMLVFVGGLNGLVLPIGLSIFMYAAWKRADLMHGYHYPRWLIGLGVLTCGLTWFMAYKSVGAIFAMLTA
ncbi:Mn2+/Fe2+ NRAMP family transporter [Rhizobium sp. PP-F2F-G38]|uniref:Divalent metal cation transporter n=1 Tax=Ferranicluibacter rubi TaxID=2715133 RepID=A0AA44CA88_9HYPH|nr:divalent metal cation transporter [Ferranicluibacter rubi]PYE32446.1 Mn2+/Fe2+ NRAMP family transporter [Rhizobium sp. PP-WC-1G-195]PYE95874.1 Mn2+/Fe2+ NRAMP family transporter [Rhizobium sp. PP-F2F-G38]TCP88520.1 Mn2+/Fe2+ NRAMP family transporter [Rhizobium sp. PP-CC-2G-626]TCQ08645.1 Mn2+/Fe2+ NRAMP family transporter [Rhizobium sp. PP-F2F-G36]TCQ22814.1 Mn2+/Fe2+ NRAMP family transporter [Rhizobium sp. PP-CC-3G-465]